MELSMKIVVIDNKEDKIILLADLLRDAFPEALIGSREHTTGYTNVLRLGFRLRLLKKNSGE
jgi:hypothetical protein